ncbi:hypothetical protein KIN20_001845 [Parelaphostrongylus tenuis]|uniref:Uncharacterized protein n=1 Tax=Parelaphostrongylus tenuis TaxID=148309 RepID=A0AAD5MMQ8_PARTN|nr:hypothetical protein KIN20_001845 [Parelaphostrongylus tenuis]
MKVGRITDLRRIGALRVNVISARWSPLEQLNERLAKSVVGECILKQKGIDMI